LYQSLSQTFTEYSEESLAVKAEGFKKRSHEYSRKSRRFRIFVGDDMDYSPSTILRKAPLALAVSLFGPFPWQIRNAVMLMSSIESTYLFFCVSFTIILGVSIGLTSFNYGALVRFKIPILPFFVTFLTVMLPPDKTVRSR
jgi:hypothetical protein